MEHPLLTDDRAYLLNELGKIGMLFGDYRRVSGNAVDRIVFDAMTNLVQIGGVHNVQHNFFLLFYVFYRDSVFALPRKSKTLRAGPAFLKDSPSNRMRDKTHLFFSKGL